MFSARENIAWDSLVKYSMIYLSSQGLCPLSSLWPIKGPEKEDEVKRQADSLLEKGMIEPASGTWSSPVVLVRKTEHGGSVWTTGS